MSAQEGDPGGEIGGGASGVLVIRAWQEQDVRARLLGEHGDAHTEAVAEGVEGICAAVREWLSDTRDVPGLTP